MNQAVVPGLAAGGTLPRLPGLAEPGALRRIRLMIEIGVLFIGAPVALLHVIHPLRLPLFFVLLVIFLGFAGYLIWDRTFSLRREFARGFAFAQLLSIAAVFLVAGLAVAAFVKQELPGLFLSFPRSRPKLWLTVMILYPLLSVAAQELIYRTFFFHRYGPLFGEARWLAISTNALLFGFGHIVVGSWIAVISTMLGGLLFAWRYQHTRSYWAVWLEHSLYGWLVWTVGIGRFFFAGVSI